jgi:hypothetical protein
MIRFPVKKQRFYLFYMSRHPERQEAAGKLSPGSEWNREVPLNKKRVRNRDPFPTRCDVIQWN